MRTQMNEWFLWNHLANETLVQAFKKSESVPNECLAILSEMVTEHDTWLNRICSLSESHQEVHGADVTTIADRIADLNRVTQSFLNSESYGRDFDWTFMYQTDKGTVSASLKQVYFHILTHSAFQRGKLSKAFRENGIELPQTDYLSMSNRQHFSQVS